jgi:hypothetical protein
MMAFLDRPARSRSSSAPPRTRPADVECGGPNSMRTAGFFSFAMSRCPPPKASFLRAAIPSDRTNAPEAISADGFALGVTLGKQRTREPQMLLVCQQIRSLSLRGRENQATLCREVANRYEGHPTVSVPTQTNTGDELSSILCCEEIENAELSIAEGGQRAQRPGVLQQGYYLSDDAVSRNHY